MRILIADRRTSAGKYKVAVRTYLKFQANLVKIPVGLKRILVLFDYSIVLTVNECYCSYSNIRLKSFSSSETWAICNQYTNQA